MNISRSFVFGYSHSPEMDDSSSSHSGGRKSSCQLPWSAVGKSVWGDLSGHIFFNPPYINFQLILSSSFGINSF